MEHLAGDDVRALLRLAGELRELGDDPAQWRRHLAARLAALCDAGITVIAELAVRSGASATPSRCAEAIRPVQIVDHGVDANARERLLRLVVGYEHGADDPLERLVPLYGSNFTVARRHLVDDRRWYGSRVVNDGFHASACDDFVMSMVPVRRTGVVSAIELFRPPRARGFTERETTLVALLHEELARDWQPDHALGPRLTARQRQVQELLAQGASEKEVADALGVSAHTVHDHVKALHRAHGVRSRGELLSRVARPAAARTRLLGTHGLAGNTLRA